MLSIKSHEINSLIKIALPLMAAFLAQKGMQLVDTIMMGWIGPQALAAGALSTSIFTLMLTFCLGTLSSVGVFIARDRGANQHETIQANLLTGIYLALILSVPCMIIIWFAPAILSAMHEQPLIIKNASLLLHGLVWGLPGFLLFFAFREFISAFAAARIVMLVCLVSIPLTMAANYVLIYGKYGFPQLGVAGIGYAGAGIMWFMFLCVYYYSKAHPLLKNYMIFQIGFEFDYRKLRSMFALGASSGLIYVLDAGMFTVAAFMMGHFGTEALAAYQIAMQCVMLAYSVPFALSMATALQVGHAVGAKNRWQAKRYAYISLGMGLIIAGSVAILFFTESSTLAKLFLNKNELHYQAVEQLAGSFLMIAVLFQCFDTLQAIMNGALRGLKDTFIPMLLCIVCYWIIGVGSAYYLAFNTSLAAKGIWYGLTLGICSASVILLLRFLSHRTT